MNYHHNHKIKNNNKERVIKNSFEKKEPLKRQNLIKILFKNFSLILLKFLRFSPLYNRFNCSLSYFYSLTIRVPFQ